MPVARAPRGTVALPLYRSAPFLDIIRANLRRLTLPDLEILISDRHQHDDAIDRLESEFGGDPRIRFLRHRDGIGWVDHFNALFREAAGEAFMWMPHDDDFPEDYVPRLLAALEAHPEAILAFGAMRAVAPRGSGLPTLVLPAPELRPGEGWSRRVHLRLTTLWNPGVAFRGLFRVKPLRDRGLFVRHTRRDVFADLYWVFATGFLGSWVYVPEVCCDKRFYPESTHARWRRTVRFWRASVSVLNAYVRDFAPSRGDAFFARVVLGLWIASEALGTVLSRRRVVGRLGPPLRRWLRALVARLVGGDAGVDFPATPGPVGGRR